jgi:hypothetical protein
MQLTASLGSSLLLIALWTGSLAHAAESTPTLGKKGKLLLEESFSVASLPKGWNVNTGTLAVKDGALVAGELAKDQHIGAFRKTLPLQDCAIQLDFKLEGARRLDLGFDPAPGELKKKGHLLSLTITPEGWNLTEHNDKANPASKAITHAKAATAFSAGQWHTLLLEVKGEQVVAHIDGKAPLKAAAPDFRVKKPGLVFRVGGKDGQSAIIDNVKVWQLE